MVETEQVDPEVIFALLKDAHSPSDDLLPDTGVGLEWERRLGTVFIDSPDYGTRSSAVITVGNNGTTTFTEKTHNPGSTTGVVQFSFVSKLH